MELSGSVLECSHIGEFREKRLKKLGIETVLDLITYYPREYEDRSHLMKIKDLTPGEAHTFRAAIEREAECIRVHQKILVRVRAKDDTGSILIAWYNQPYLKNMMMVGQEYVFTGKVTQRCGKKEVQSPEYERCKEEELLSAGRIIPVYSVTNGLSQKVIRGLIRDTLERTRAQLTEFLPLSVREAFQLADRGFAVFNIHFPADKESFFIARKRLVFEELFLLQTALLKRKTEGKKKGPGKKMQLKKAEEESLLSVLPFSLTNAQKRVWEEIKQDFASGTSMNRMVQGDVGSGKTALAVLSAYTAAKNGRQAVLMAPTEVLAGQHFQTFYPLFEKLGIHTVLLTGSMKKKEKELALKELLEGTAQMVIGTHAVIQKNVAFQNLGLVITDEQHRFGVRQRSVLAEKGENPHILVMTATPIPRTLALILYGDLDISILDELPPGRQKIDTLAVTSAYHERIYTFIKKELTVGRQAYIICPMIEETDKAELTAVLAYMEKLKTGPFREFSVACLHGKMKPEEKTEAMKKFADGEIQVLVSTTVVEVGVNVPNATIMLIENADRFGLAQLHQLRGRVGRGSQKSYCILVSDAKNQVAKQRMKTMKESDDGFVISEMDLKLRGPGEFFGTKQHGLPEMKIANLYRDIGILKEAQQAADLLLKHDPGLLREENQALALELSKYFKCGRVDM